MPRRFIVPDEITKEEKGEAKDARISWTIHYIDSLNTTIDIVIASALTMAPFDPRRYCPVVIAGIAEAIDHFRRKGE